MKRKSSTTAAKGTGGKGNQILHDLHELSRNLWWSWQPEGRSFWARVAEVVPATRRDATNPCVVVAALNAKRAASLGADPKYVALHERFLRRFRQEVGRQLRAPKGLSSQAPVAYFSMEFGVHESLAIYAGGLGILAGDHTKSASDEGVPLVGVGLYYRRGYFRQDLNEHGKQEVVQGLTNPAVAPLEAVRGKNGRELRIGVELPQGKVQLRAWQLRVGRVSVYLLDADVPENRPRDRRITHRLYSIDRRERIQQELLAGIGGVRLLGALGIRPGVWHLNEGHVAFLTLERLRIARQERGLEVPEALESIAADTVFTTHTPVPEGNEVFDLALARLHLAPYAKAAGISIDEYLSLGLDWGADNQPVLSMTVLALRLSRFRNGVSALHGEVSRDMWKHLWPGFRAADVPIGSVTNGVHMPTWVAPEMDALYRRHLGAQWTRHQDDAEFWKKSAAIPDRELWETKQNLKAKLVRFVREREDARLRRFGWTASRRERAVGDLLNPEAFTIGFARRFALYKRADLIFHDLKRAARLFGSRSRPVQIVFSGKPHPEDPLGREVCERIAAFAKRKEFHGRVVLLENYDMEIGRHMVQGVDLWLNNPRRPLEASGTSGQKVPLNGGVNCSILDGWWCEGYTPRVGFAFGKTEPYEDLNQQDRDDSSAMYRVLEKEVVPLYYQRDRGGLPRRWLRMVKAAIASTAPTFSSSHMVLEYVRNLYVPALEHSRSLRAQQAGQLVSWKEDVFQSWPLVHLRDAADVAGGLEVDVFLAGISPEDIACLSDDGNECSVAVVKTMGPGLHRVRIAGRRRGRGASARCLRIFPVHPSLAHPQELGLSLEIEV